jgi:hypothetical protein
VTFYVFVQDPPLSLPSKGRVPQGGGWG